MLTISFPKTVDLANGVFARINGSPTVVIREENYLVYRDEDDRVNRCLILDEAEVSALPMPDGSRCVGVIYYCASDEQDASDCDVLKGGAK